MSFLAGSSEDSWQPEMTARTATSTYWLNWRVFLCAIWVLISMIFSLFLIQRYEGFRKERRDNGEDQKESAGSLYEDEVWRPCLKGIHPAWLLAFRVIGFLVLLVLLIIIGIVDGASIFYYYTQWTFTSVTLYFALGSLLSMYGCYQYQKSVSGDKVDSFDVDSENGTSVPAILGESSTGSIYVKNSGAESFQNRQPAGNWGYLFQIIFQINAGAVMLTDIVFWFIIVPFLAIKDYQLNFLEISMHTINAVFLLGDTALNCLRFPWFRIAYFFLWTIFYVTFQWIIHACVSLWWPYPFLDLSSPFSPLWYWLVAVMHVPCYGIFVLIIKLKHNSLSKWFPDTYQCAK